MAEDELHSDHSPPEVTLAPRVVTVPAGVTDVVLKPKRALPFFSRHPWVYAGAIGPGPEPPVGAVVDVRSDTGKFIARGLYNAESRIRIRLYSWDANVPLDGQFWKARISEAIELRQRLFRGTPTEHACRLICSEGDGLSGLTVDRYGDYLIVQWTSQALAVRQEEILDLLTEQLQPQGIWLRTEKGIGEVEGLAIRDGLLRGTAPPESLLIEENGATFEVDLKEGQKTGFYFDHRDNRAAAARYMRDANVLDLFCYTGSFGLVALKHGAKSVTAVDASETALAIGRKNAERNGCSDRITWECANIFRKLEELQAAKQQFDAVILDPPKMARNAGGLDKAMRGYFSLNRMAIDLLPPGGILVTSSCSGLVTREAFEQTLTQVGLNAGRRMQILESRGPAPDHPVSIYCPENNYLKCVICRVI